MRIAVSGGTGCLGRPLVANLLKKGFLVKLLRTSSSPIDDRKERNIEYIEGTINDKVCVKRLLSGCEIVFHLAGKVHGSRLRRKDESDYYRVNSDGTKLMVKTCKEENVKRIIFFSTVGVYGAEDDFHGDEDSPCDPKTPYSRSKYIAEQYILNAYKSGGPEGIVLRLPLVYGPYDRGNVAVLIKAIFHKIFFYFGNGNCSRSMISSRNAANAALNAAFEPSAANKLFCVTDGKDYTLRELVETICYTLNTRWRPLHIPLAFAERVGKVGDLLEKSLGIQFIINSERVRKLSRSLTFSCDQAKQILRYEPEDTLVEGINREVEWLKATHGLKR